MESNASTVSARGAIVKPERLNHLGVEVFDDADVGNAANRIRAAGLQYSGLQRGPVLTPICLLSSCHALNSARGMLTLPNTR